LSDPNFGAKTIFARMSPNEQSAFDYRTIVSIKFMVADLLSSVSRENASGDQKDATATLKFAFA
jgi:hypothetical protein